MIRSFKCRKTKDLYEDNFVSKFKAFEKVARRKLEMLDASKSLLDLKSPPSNRLEMLRGNRKGTYSIRINDQFRLCFKWEKGNATDVEIVDYHRG